MTPKESQQAEYLAKSLVEEVWNLGAIPTTFVVEYEGAEWKVSISVKETDA